jgi:hypothetical protein
MAKRLVMKESGIYEGFSDFQPASVDWRERAHEDDGNDGK